MGIALITGASSGIGAELAKVFAKNNHSVILVARRKDRLEQMVQELKKSYSVDAWCVDIDLSEIDAGKTLFQRVKQLNLQVDFLVNNAGVGTGGAFQNLPLARELEMIDLNVRSLVEITHLFLAPMIQRRSGNILNIGSIAGFQPGPFMNTYSATKAFVNSFSEGLHEELKGTGVSCTVVAPGYTATEFQKAASIPGFKGSFNKSTPAEVAKDAYNAMIKNQAMKVSGFLNFLGTQTVRLSPRSLARKIAGQVNRQQV